MQKFNAAFRFALLCAPVALMACSSLPMPTGYTYHNEVYKAPPGPEASRPAKIVDTNGMSQTGSMSATLSEEEQRRLAQGSMDAEAFRGVADELVRMMLTNFGRPMEPSFINESSPLTASLKASFAAHGIPVALNPGDGPFVIDHSISGNIATMVFFSNHDRVTSFESASTVQPVPVSTAPVSFTETTITETTVTEPVTHPDAAPAVITETVTPPPATVTETTTVTEPAAAPVP
jgi:hypothetical protein